MKKKDIEGLEKEKERVLRVISDTTADLMDLLDHKSGEIYHLIKKARDIIDYEEEVLRRIDEYLNILYNNKGI